MCWIRWYKKYQWPFLLYVTNSGAFYRVTIYLLLALLKLMELDLLHAQYKKTAMSELIFSLKRKKNQTNSNLPAFTQINSIKTGQISA